MEHRTCTRTYIHICTFMKICKFLFSYFYSYIYIHIHIYVYMYMYIITSTHQRHVAPEVGGKQLFGDASEGSIEQARILVCGGSQPETGLTFKHVWPLSGGPLTRNLYTHVY